MKTHWNLAVTRRGAAAVETLTINDRESLSELIHDLHADNRVIALAVQAVSETSWETIKGTLHPAGRLR